MFEWKETYSVGINEIDEQHKRLFEIGREVSDLLGVYGVKDVKEEVELAIESLIDYTKYHFEFEEKLMEKYSYPDLEIHKEEHLEFVENIINLKNELKEGHEIDVILGSMAFIAEWIFKHIAKSDAEYSRYINK